ncbi:MAG: ABC transporter substrate-binding protein [Anaerolineae bacterium]|nr:ABC transporter substrate-binding protein [Anaerolineae bacterium]
MKPIIPLCIVALLALAVVAPLAAQSTEPEVPEVVFPLTLEDETGTEITLESPAERILCLSIACLDFLYSLEITPAGMTDLLTIPYALHFGELTEDQTIIEGGMTPDVEQIAAMEPDLIIGQAGFFDPLRPALESVAPMYLSFPNTLEETIAQFEDVAAMTNHAADAFEVVERFNARLGAYAEAVEDEDVSLMIVFGAAENETMFLEAASGQTCDMLSPIAECLFDVPEGAGGMAAFGYDFFSMEAILEADPDVIFFSGYNPDRTENDEVLQRLAEDPLWNALSAVEGEEVYNIEPWVWRAGRGLAFLEVTLDQFMTTVFAETFPKPLELDEEGE